MLRVAILLLLAAILAHPAPAAERGPMPLTTTAPANAQAADVLEECTIAVLSGSVTADGRPILWKNRDSGYINNEVAYFDDGVYPYVTIINAGDPWNAWVGVNESGFAVLNALSYNLPEGGGGQITNGVLMKRALQTCATVDDFEKLLQQTAVPGRLNPANLAVIDALGGAAVFEVESQQHHRFDASGRNAVAAGYLVRANFSMSADTAGLDTWRFRRASALVDKAVHGRARRADLFRVSRDLCSALCDPYPLPFEGKPPGFPDARGYVDTRETIQRVSTVSSGLIHGVRPGEDPRLSTFFVALGKPAVAPFVPAWVLGGATPPELDGPQTAPFCDLALAGAQDCFDYPGVPRLISTWKLASPTGATRSYQGLLHDIELAAHARVDSLLAVWRVGGALPADVAAQEKLLSASMYQTYQRNSGGGSAPAIAWRVTPTPMRDQVGILAAATEAGAVAPEWLEIYDLGGRRMARVAGRERPDGLARPIGQAEAVLSGFTWDGRDESGRIVPAGLYFGRVPGASSSARILVVR